MFKLKTKIAPSILAADFTRLGEEIRRVEKAGADLLHVDVMDGRFVPNITVGPMIVAAMRRATRLPLDVHLMIVEPWDSIDRFAACGADQIIVHAEACGRRLKHAIDRIRKCGKLCGVSLRPQTPLDPIKAHLGRIDSVLLMTVNPGFGGQKFMPEVLPKIRALRKIFNKDISVDGGVNAETAKWAVQAGANVLVAGTAIFPEKNAKKAIARLRNL